ncbi:iron ABC transporter permease [Falsiroseomonas sp.]|uniref:ABC transporter permease n=1 Tax=Falsiroseomonas sp. TaxID=2870721 RepID=UPI0027198858|nr:iron ABC transporter permease [Falsiroseomonas sp.]MDO9502143.1 iron ABC transporter permease [Falsiroseomonas sp.]MDP3417588.1 iron ABC transporter permease [Falsiroseomonas sp.]
MQIVAALLVAAFLLAFLIVPVGRVFMVAFQAGDGAFTLVHFADFFRTSLFIESFWNSLYVASMSVVFASLIAVPLAVMLARYRFPGTALITTLGVLPLVMPPFVGAVAMQLVFGRNGTVNLLLMDWFGFRLDLMDGLNGVIFVQSLHYFPFILMNLTASLSNVDISMEEAGQNLGAKNFTLLRRIVLPLALPGYLAGASLVFVKVFDDLATPLMLNVTNMLAPQAYLRVTSVGLADPMGYVISVILVVVSVAAMGLAALLLRGRDYATQQRGGGGLGRRELSRRGLILCWCFVVPVLFLVLAPHIGILLLSFGTIWSFSPLPDGLTLEHYGTVLRETPQFITNTLLYCGLAGLIDVVIGVTIAWLVLRTKLPGRKLLDLAAMSALAVPGLVLGIGILRTYFDVKLWDGASLATSWIMLTIVLAVRRLPYALRASTAALQQVHRSLEEAAENMGAGKVTTLRRIVVPLMAGGLAAAFVTSFATAAVELSATLVLATRDVDAPLSFGIYLFMQSASGRGPGAALGVIAVLVVAICTFAAHRFAERERGRRTRSSDPRAA